MRGGAVGEGHDGQKWVEATIRHMDGTITDIQIVVTVQAAMGIGCTVRRVVTHAARPGLMLDRPINTGRVGRPISRSPRTLAATLPRDGA